MAHIKLGIINDKNIPISKPLNRTSMFEPIQARHRNNTIDQSNSLLFKDKNFKLSMYGNKLNHTYDYPLLALIIKHWLNSRVKEVETQKVKVTLSEIYNVLNLTFDKTKDKNYIPIESSILRLHGANMRLETKKIKIKEWSSLINNPKMLFGEFGYIEVEIGNVLNKLYKDIFSIQHLESSFIDLNQITSVRSESTRALMKFFMSQSKSFIDFKFDLLCKVLGYDKRDIKERKKREYIKDSLKELVSIGYLTTFETRDSEQLTKLAKWEQIRIIPAKLTQDPSKADELLISLKSNFKDIKNYYRSKKAAEEFNDEIPF